MEGKSPCPNPGPLQSLLQWRNWSFVEDDLHAGKTCWTLGREITACNGQTWLLAWVDWESTEGQIFGHVCDRVSRLGQRPIRNVSSNIPWEKWGCPRLDKKRQSLAGEIAQWLERVVVLQRTWAQFPAFVSSMISHNSRSGGRWSSLLQKPLGICSHVHILIIKQNYWRGREEEAQESCIHFLLLPDCTWDVILPSLLWCCVPLSCEPK